MIDYDERGLDARVVRARKIAHLVVEEIDRAYAKHTRKQWGRHELFAILQEEVEEVIEAFRFRFLLPKRMRRLWQNIRADKSQEELEKEIIQVAAMCFRYLETGDRYRQPAVEFRTHEQQPICGIE